LKPTLFATGMVDSNPVENGIKQNIGEFMNRGPRIQIFTVALIGTVLAVQMTTTSAATIAKASQICSKVGRTGVTKTGQKLVCVKYGKKLLWKVAPVKAKLPSPPKVTPSATPSATATESPSPTPTPTATAIKVAGLISADCVALILKFGASLGSQDSTVNVASEMDKLNTCMKDTGVTEVITSSPFNPVDIGSITKFRSCAGHDFAEGSGDGQVTSKDPQYEKFSSMKHYITPLKQNANDRTDAFAPFDGFVSRVADESAGQTTGKTYANPGSQIQLISYANPAISFTYFHVYGLSVKAGDAVTSGQKIAYHEIQGVNAGRSSYDIAMSKFDMAAMLAKATRRLSMMNYLSPTVASIFVNVGLTPENSIWSAQYRTTNPCLFTGSLGFFQGPENPADRVTLKH